MKRLEICSLVLSPLLGFMAFFVPVLFTGNKEFIEEISFVSLVSRTFENMVILPTLFSLFAVGFLLGFLCKKFWWLLGLITVLIFPVMSVYEMNVSPTSHNLWPIEFIIYGALSIPAITGSFFGSRISSRKTKPQRKGIQV